MYVRFVLVSNYIFHKNEGSFSHPGLLAGPLKVRFFSYRILTVSNSVMFQAKFWVGSFPSRHFPLRYDGQVKARSRLSVYLTSRRGQRDNFT